VDMVSDMARARACAALARRTAEAQDWDRVVQQLETICLSVAEAGLEQHDTAA
jgi:hypothetical protein